MTPPLPADVRRYLLAVARDAIAAGFGRREAGPPSPDHPSLRERRGAFVTLSLRGSGELRGCVGYVEPHFSLVETVARAAAAAAFEDDRFTPLTPGELPAVSLDLSVLERPRPIRADEVEVGRHGLIVGRQGRRGLLLPQVPVEHGWDRETFLDHTCLKAGLPPESWRREGTEILAFEAEVFGEDDPF
jgi:AmmeMemoRadiSam system protein A